MYFFSIYTCFCIEINATNMALTWKVCRKMLNRKLVQWRSSQYLKESILKNGEAVLKYVRVQESDQANTIRLHVLLYY